MTPNESHSNPTSEKVTDPIAAIRVRINPNISFMARNSGGNTSYVAHDSRTGKYFRFGAAEYHVCSLLDGRRAIHEIQHQLATDGLEWSLGDVAGFAAKLIQHRIADSFQSAEVISEPRPRRSQAISPMVESSTGKSEAWDRPIRLSSRLEHSQAHQQKQGGSIDLEQKAKSNSPWLVLLQPIARLLSLRIPLVDGNKVAARTNPIVGRLFSRSAVTVWAITVSVGWLCVFQNRVAFQNEITKLFSTQLWIPLIGVWVALKVIHELGHAVSAHRYGVRVGKMGVTFFLLAPLAYVDVTDAWKLNSRSKRVSIALAGVYLESWVGALAAMLWWWLPTGFAGHMAAQVFLIAGPATLLINANPLLRLDGYYVLSDWLDIPNLRMHGRNQLVGWFESRWFLMPARPALLSGWRRWTAAIHACLSIAFQIVWMTTLLIAVFYWAGSLGIVIGIVAALFWVVIPLCQWGLRVWRHEPRVGIRFSPPQRRLIGLAMIAFVVIEFSFSAASPLDRRIPVVVRHANEQMLRASSDAFVDSVLVQCGDRVQEGQLLIQLHQSDLQVRRDQLQDRRDVALRKVVQYSSRGDIALARAEKSNAEGLTKQLETLQTQIDQLRVVAGRDGTIISPLTDSLLGNYVRQGDPLVQIGDPNEKELVAIVGESDVSAYRRASNRKNSAAVRLRGGMQIAATVAPLLPRAQTSLPHPALSAAVGGPLAIRSSEDSGEYELVQPKMISICALDSVTSASVRSGQIGRLTIPDDRSVMSRIWEQLSEVVDAPDR